MGWAIVLGLVAAGLLAVGFVLLTEGRYFGKRLIYWVYDLIGPAAFSSRSEAGRWRPLIEAVVVRGDERVLDVGTAVGDLPLTIAATHGFQGQVTGVDWSPRMIEKAREEAERRGLDGRLRFQAVDIRKGLPFDVGAFDVVCCLGLLETLPGPERVLDELRRVLKQDGAMALSLYRGMSASSVALSLAWYERHLGALGLDEVSVVPCRRHHDVVIARPRGT
jgi:ubiquinone/menaquinone biosynthesis C-methylase UbiE